MRLSLVLLLPVLFLVACRANTPTNTDVAISIALASESPAVGEETIVRVSLVDSAGNPIDNATVNLRGDMSHAGMTPVLGEATTGTNGVYEIPFIFSMSGDWIMTVDVTLADGSKDSESFNITGIGSEAPTEEAPESFEIGVSAAYLTISNNGTEDVRLNFVTAAGVGESSIHQTIVEDNIARMEAVEGGFLVPAGETVELAPGGHHVMLMDLSTPLVEGETLEITFSFDNDVSVTVQAPITNFPPDEGGSGETETIRITGAWLRPTASGE